MKRDFSRKPEPSNKYRVNRQIRVPEVRLINAANEQVGVVTTDEARRIADEAGLDLVEVQPNAEPPVCRVMDFGKFKYAQKKKERGQAKPHSTLKELRVRPAIDPHDLEYRLVQGRKFLEEGHKVQVVCIFRGRQRSHPELGYNVMKKVTEALADISKVETPPRMNGPRLNMLLSRKGASSSHSGPSSAPPPRAPVNHPGPAPAASGNAPAPKPATPAPAKPAADGAARPAAPRTGLPPDRPRR